MIRKPLFLWILFVLVIALMIGFYFWKPYVGGAVLDNVCSLESMQSLLVKMSDMQKRSHIMMTLTLDIIFPFAYGFLLAGIILRLSRQSSLWWTLPAFTVIPIDIAENIIQLMALSGNEILLPLKVLLTPLKFALIILAMFFIVYLFRRSRVKMF